MGKKAVDVVLLPDEAMSEQAIDANRELVRQCGEKIVLNKENCLPHISLAMGCMEEGDFAAVEAALKEIAGRTSLGQMEVIGVDVSANSVGEKVSVFEVERTAEIQSLHEEIMEKLAPYLCSDVTKEMLYEPREVGRSTLLWIENYREKSSFENFFPHITIGYGELQGVALPVKFTARKLALCHLGNYCTCRKILAAIKLGAGR